MSLTRLLPLTVAVAALAVPGTAVAALPAEGTIVMDEVRFTGPNGEMDEFIELYNTTSAPINLNPPDPNPNDQYSNWWIEYFAEAVNPFPAGCPSSYAGRGYVSLGFPGNMTIPARGRVLYAVEPNATETSPGSGDYVPDPNSGYSLEGYAEPDVLDPDVKCYGSIAAGEGVRLYAYDEATDTGGVIDAVGHNSATQDNVGSNVDYFEGTPLSPIGLVTGQYSWLRRRVSGMPSDATDSNASDFHLLDVNAATYNGVAAWRGTPGPQGLNSPLNKPVRSYGIDPNKGINESPNREISGGFMIIRRRLENISGSALANLRLRLQNLSTTNSGSVGQLAPVSSTGGTVATSTGNQTVLPLTLEKLRAADPNEGGTNSSLTLPAGTTLGNGMSLNVELKLKILASGSYSFGYVVEAQ